METHVKQKITENRITGIIQKLGWSNRKVAGRFPTTPSNGLHANSTSGRTEKEVKDFNAEFECRRAQGLAEADRYRNRMMR